MTKISMNKRYKRRGCGTEVRLLATDLRRANDYCCLYVNPKGHYGLDNLISTRADGRYLVSDHPNDLIEIQPTLFGLWTLTNIISAIQPAESRSEYINKLYDFQRDAISEGRLTVVEIKTTQEGDA